MKKPVKSAQSHYYYCCNKLLYFMTKIIKKDISMLGLFDAKVDDVCIELFYTNKFLLICIYVIYAYLWYRYQ